MATQSAALISQIADLQADFQRIAKSDPWVCLAVPPLAVRPPWAGELVHSHAPKPDPPGLEIPSLVDGRGRPIPSTASRARFRQQREQWNQEFDLRGPPPWVVPPSNPRWRTVVDHVNVLTDSASRLLGCVLEELGHFPPGLGQDTQELLRQGYASAGWVRWIEYAVPPQRLPGGSCPGRYENYAQVAATALLVLKCAATNAAGGAIGLRTNASRPTKGKKTLEESPKKSDNLKLQVYNHIQAEHANGKKPAAILADLKANQDRKAQVKEAGLKLDKALIKAALARPGQRERDKKRKKQESPST